MLNGALGIEDIMVDESEELVALESAIRAKRSEYEKSMGHDEWVQFDRYHGLLQERENQRFYLATYDVFMMGFMAGLETEEYRESLKSACCDCL